MRGLLFGIAFSFVAITIAAAQVACPQPWRPNEGQPNCTPLGAGICDLIEPPLRAQFTGRNGDLLNLMEFTKGGIRRLLSDVNEMRKSMGGERLACDDVVTNDTSIIAVIAGRERDILHAYGMIRDETKRIIGIQRAIVRFRDGKDIQVQIQADDVLVTYGREHDLRTRICFGHHAMTSPGLVSADIGGSNEWYWFGEASRAADFPPCLSRLSAGGSGDTDWGQRAFNVGDVD